MCCLLLALTIAVVVHSSSLGQSQKLAQEKAELNTLLFVHAVWRHGDRTPTRVIPSDRVNTREKWKEKFGGLGQLTELGALQHFELGRLLRQRYDTFFSSVYSPEEFVYRSSDYNRTKMSALANQQGMFAPAGQLTPKLPLTAHTPPQGVTLTFRPHGKDPLVYDEVECPVANTFDDLLFEGAEFKELENSNGQFLQFISEKAGFAERLPLRRISYVHDPLTSIFAHRRDGFRPPEWAENATTREEIFQLYNMKNSFDFKREQQKRLWAGPLFTDIFQRMECFNAHKSKEKFHAYSGHDGTIAGLLAIFGIFPDVFPTFANAVLLELHRGGEKNAENLKEGELKEVEKDESKLPFIRLFHKNETTGKRLWEYEIPECAHPCTLERLGRTRRNFLIDLKKWKKECGL